MMRDEIHTLFGENFEASVCDLTKGWLLGAIGEINKLCAGARRKVLVFGYRTIVT